MADKDALEAEYFRRRFMLARQSQTDGAERLELTDNRADMRWRPFDLRTPPLGRLAKPPDERP